MEKLYPKRVLQKALKDAGLHFSYPTLLRYEKNGVINRPKGEVKYADRAWRFYSQEEISTIVAIVRKKIKERKI
jgi:membrane protein implicated in regulation of membrane protease activity